jgi:hypothetical protein
MAIEEKAKFYAHTQKITGLEHAVRRRWRDRMQSSASSIPDNKRNFGTLYKGA